MDERIKAHMALVNEMFYSKSPWERDHFRRLIEAELRAPQQAEEILQSLGWTCIGGVWTEDRAATATLAPQQAEGWVSLDRKLVEQAVEVLMEMGLEDTGLGLHNAMLAARPSAPTAVEPAQDAVDAELPTGWSIHPSQAYPGALCIDGPGSSTLIDKADNLHPLFAAISAKKGGAS